MTERASWRIAAHHLDVLRCWAAGIELAQGVWVFGSRARGTARPDSDLDVAVRFEGEHPSVAAGNAIALRARAEDDLRQLISDVSVNLTSTCPEVEEDYIWPRVMQEGILIWEPVPGAAVAPFEEADPTGEGEGDEEAPSARPSFIDQWGWATEAKEG